METLSIDKNISYALNLRRKQSILNHPNYEFLGVLGMNLGRNLRYHNLSPMTEAGISPNDHYDDYDLNRDTGIVQCIH